MVYCMNSAKGSNYYPKQATWNILIWSTPVPRFTSIQLNKFRVHTFLNNWYPFSCINNKMFLQRKQAKLSAKFPALSTVVKRRFVSLYHYFSFLLCVLITAFHFKLLSSYINTWQYTWTTFILYNHLPLLFMNVNTYKFSRSPTAFKLMGYLIQFNEFSLNERLSSKASFW
jgi:hypothetical protein